MCPCVLTSVQYRRVFIWPILRIYFKTVALNQENNREVLFNKWSEQNPLLAGRAVASPAGGVSISSKMKDRALMLKEGVTLAKAQHVHNAAYFI